MTAEQNEVRQKQVERLYLRNREHLRDVIVTNRDLLATDADNIIDNLVQHLPSFDGQLTDEAFTEWASNIAQLAAQRIERFYKILEAHGGAIRGGIWSVLSTNQFDDNPALAEEVFQEVAFLVFLHLNSFTKPGKAKLSTRLYGLAKRHALDYHVKKSRRRLRALAKRLSQGGSIECPEVLSNEELASTAAEQQEAMTG